MGMPEAKTCPECGNILQPGEVPRSLTPVRLLATDLLLWATVALFLAFLWSPRADGEIYAALGAAALVVWALLRARQRADLAVLAESGRHECARCGLQFVGDDLRRVSPPD
jgi:hypothetical protein